MSSNTSSYTGFRFTRALVAVLPGLEALPRCKGDAFTPIATPC
ncbi:MAG: hypothetical protein U0263_31090 [Polyangiaceae bacterium]